MAAHASTLMNAVLVSVTAHSCVQSLMEVMSAIVAKDTLLTQMESHVMVSVVFIFCVTKMITWTRLVTNKGFKVNCLTRGNLWFWSEH